jgi:hypothetical protein
MQSAGLFHPRKCVSFTLAELDDDNALVLSDATQTSEATYSGAGLDGALGGTMRLPQYVTLTTSAVASQYVAGSEALVTGTLNGRVVTDILTITDANGGEVLVGDQAFDTVVSIVLDAQANTSGAVEFGVVDVLATRYKPGVQFEHGASGDVEFDDDEGVTEVITGNTGAKREVVWMRISAANTTSDPVILYTGTDRG